MPIITTQEGYLGFGKQGAQGSDTAPTEFIYLSGAESIENIQESENYIELTGKRFPSITLKKFHKVDGGFPMFCRPDIAGFLTAMFMGKDGFSGTAVPYTHVLTVEKDVPWMSIERRVGSGTTLVERIEDAKFDTLSVAAEVGEPVVLEFGFLGTTVEVQSGTTVPSHDTQKPFVFANGTFQLDDGATTEITSFNISMRNNLKGEIFSDKITREDIIEGNFEVDLSFTLKFIDADWYKKVYYGSTGGTIPQTDLYSGNFHVDLTYGTGVDLRQYKIEIAKVFFVAAPVHLTNEVEPIYQECEGFMVEPAAGEAVTITVQNTDAADYID